MSDPTEHDPTIPATVSSDPEPPVRLHPPDDDAPATVVPSSAQPPPDPAAPAAQQQRYHLRDEIARGGMGAVLRGRDAVLGRDVAVKVLLEGHHGDGEYHRRFVEEAQIAGQLQHPGVVPVYELGRLPDGRPFFAMKLVKGQTLAKLLAVRPEPSHDRPRFLKVFEQVCQTLAYAHSRGVIHRDLKPNNVMVGAFGEVQVMDWGLAKLLRPGCGGPRPAGEGEGTVIRTSGRDVAPDEEGGQTVMGSVMGTAAYVPPEQALGEVDRIDERCDVFGLGAILCEILSGKPPYVGPDSARVWQKARRGDLAEAFARLDACDADAELIALAKRCLAPEPEDRPRDGAAVAAAVTGHLESVSERLRQAELAKAAEHARRIEAQATAEQERKAREAAVARSAAEKRARLLTLSLAATALLVILIGGGAWGWVRQERADKAAQKAIDDARRESLEDLNGVLEAKREAIEDAAIQDSSSMQTLMLVLQEHERDPGAVHVVKKIQLVQTLGRLVFADGPKAQEAAERNWRLLKANLTHPDTVWFPKFLGERGRELDTINSGTATAAQKRESLLRLSNDLRAAVEKYGEQRFLEPLRTAMLPHWVAQAKRAAERLTAAAEGGRPELVSFYKSQFWRLRCGELVLVGQEGFTAALEEFGEALEAWEAGGDAAGMRSWLEAIRKAGG